MKTIIYFTAPWCAPCKQLSPTMAQLMGEGMSVQKVNVDNDTDFTTKYSVRSVPTLVLVDQNGTELKRMGGNRSKQEVLNFYNG